MISSLQGMGFLVVRMVANAVGGLVIVVVEGIWMAGGLKEPVLVMFETWQCSAPVWAGLCTQKHLEYHCV